MKIKKVEELNENFNNDDSMSLLKKLLFEVYDDAVDSVSYDDIDGYNSLSFDSYWDLNGDKLLTKYNILNVEENTNNVRQILPDMVRLSNNSRITQGTAEIIADKLPKDKFRDFMTWLKLVEQNCSNKTKNKFF